MKRLPARINILGTMFEVIEDTLEGDDCGYSQQHNRLIVIDKDQPYDAKIETLFHEVAHIILKHLGYSHLLGDDLEEGICQGMGVALSFVIGANPELSQLHVVAAEGDAE